MTCACVRRFFILIRTVMEHQKLATLSCYEKKRIRQRRSWVRQTHPPPKKKLSYFLPLIDMINNIYIKLCYKKLTSKMPILNGNSLCRTWRLIGILDRNGNQLKKQNNLSLKIGVLWQHSFNVLPKRTLGRQYPSRLPMSEHCSHYKGEYLQQFYLIIHTYHTVNVAMTTIPSLKTLNMVGILNKT